MLFSRGSSAGMPTALRSCPSVSYGISVAAANVPVHEGEKIIILEDQFPSNVYSVARAGVARTGEARHRAAPRRLRLDERPGRGNRRATPP